MKKDNISKNENKESIKKLQDMLRRQTNCLKDKERNKDKRRKERNLGKRHDRKKL